MIEKEIITRMFQIEKDSYQLIEETKGKANQLIAQARNKSKNYLKRPKKHYLKIEKQ